MGSLYNYQDYIHGGLLNARYLKSKDLNEGSFGIVSVAKDTFNDDKLVAVKYNTGKLSDFANYSPQQQDKHQASSEDAKTHQHEVRSVSLNSKTKSVIKSNVTYSQTDRSSNDVSKSIVRRETNYEIDMLLKIGSHPNITKLLDYFDTFMIFEYAPRGDLHDAIHLGIAPVNTGDVINVFMQLINAVDHCHKNGVYHRDIKPENILITENWTIQLTDFGLATDHLICNDFDVGSERYMAPELLEHNDIINYLADKVDIWSLGICMLNIVFGKSPFKSASSKDRLFMNFANNRETLLEIFPSMSYDLFSVMMNSLTIDPANRDLNAIKASLNHIEVLTYDYEFDYEDDDKLHIDEIIDENNILNEEDEEDERETPSPDWHNHSMVDPLEINPIQISPKKKYEPPRRIYVDLDENYHPHSNLRKPVKKRFNFNQRKPLRVPDIQITEDYDNGLDFNRKDFFTPKADLIDYMEMANRKKRDLQVNGNYPISQLNSTNNRFTYSNCNKSMKAWKRRSRRFSHNKDGQWTSHNNSNNINTSHHYNSGRRHSNVKKRQSFTARRSNSNRRPSSSSSNAITTVKVCSNGKSHKSSISGPKSIDGKYIPPNARSHYESVFSEDEDDEDEEDQIFSFDKSGSASKDLMNLSKSIKKLKVFDSSRETSLGTSSTVDSTYEKYIPPHHRRHSVTSHSTTTKTGILKKPTLGNLSSCDKKQVKIVTPISSSAPTDTINWFNLTGKFEDDNSKISHNGGGHVNGFHNEISDDNDDDYLFSIDEDHSFHNDLNFN